MKNHSLPDLIALGDCGLLQRALKAGQLTHDRMGIILPDDFDFSGSSIPYLPAEPYKTQPTPEPEEPTILQLLTNFTGAMERWSQAGFPIITKTQYDARSAACEPCSYWDGSARLGLGKCNAPGCGCTKFKRWLATETCRHPSGSKWPALR